MEQVDFRRTIVSRTERREVAYTKHQLHNHVPAAIQLNTMKPPNASPNSTRLEMWEIRIQETSSVVKMGILPAEFLPAGSKQSRLLAISQSPAHRSWPSKDRPLRNQTMFHLLCCQILSGPCTLKYLATVVDRAMAWARRWQHLV